MNTLKREIHFATHLAKLLCEIYIKLIDLPRIQVNDKVYMHVYTFLKSDGVYFALNVYNC